jgi:hypothetical protein
MTFQKNADAANIGRKRFDAYQSNQPIFRVNSNKIGDLSKCVQCRSDYMKFSVQGVCQDCQQKVEFILREHPKYAQTSSNTRRAQ